MSISVVYAAECDALEAAKVNAAFVARCRHDTVKRFSVETQFFVYNVLMLPYIR